MPNIGFKMDVSLGHLITLATVLVTMAIAFNEVQNSAKMTQTQLLNYSEQQKLVLEQQMLSIRRLEEEVRENRQHHLANSLRLNTIDVQNARTEEKFLTLITAINELKVSIGEMNHAVRATNIRNGSHTQSSTQTPPTPERR